MSVALLNPNGIDASRLLEAGQIIDTYLLALAVHHGGRLVSFDRRLSCEAVPGGREALWLIDGRPPPRNAPGRGAADRTARGSPGEW